jgi:hypothetical protein
MAQVAAASAGRRSRTPKPTARRKGESFNEFSTRPETKSTKDSRRNERECEIMRNLALLAESPRAVKITQKVLAATLKDETGQADRILSNLCMAPSWKGPCP